MPDSIENKSNNHPKYFSRVKDRYLNAILNGKEQEALASITYALTEEWDLLSIYSELISSSIRNIGDMWHQNEITISHEHRASQITLNILTYLRNNLVKTPVAGPLAIVTTIEGDPHIIGPRIIADILLINHWKVDFLGTDTPSEDLLKFIEIRNPELVVLSGTLESSFDVCQNLTKKIKNIPDNINVIWSGSGVLKKSKVNGSDLTKAEISENINIEEKYCPNFLAQNPNSTLKYIENLSKSSIKKISTSKLLKIIGSNIQYFRVKKNLNQSELASMSNVDRTFLSGIENGKRNISISALQKISRSLEIDINDLFNPAN